MEKMRMLFKENESEDFTKVDEYRDRFEKAQGFRGIWNVVKDTIKDSLGEHRVGMLLFLDNLPLEVGAYHPLGTNNIVLNRTLVQLVEVATNSKRHVNAFIYRLLAHEYLHALGHVSETEVQTLVYGVSRECFGEDHIVTKFAKESPWTLLEGVPLRKLDTSERRMEIVKDFETITHPYIF